MSNRNIQQTTPAITPAVALNVSKAAIDGLIAQLPKMSVQQLMNITQDILMLRRKYT